jgi:dihydrofolate synthase / folylpolyglutamate synthase
VQSAEYRQLVEELFPRLSGGIRWGLDRTHRLLAAVGDPHLRYPTLHVAGTNGKGSTAAQIASILHASGHRVGLYTSPHLCDFRERIRVNGVPIPEAGVLAAARRLRPALDRESPTFFEATTAIGLLALADAAVDIAVVEVGLGGRLDATNVVAPMLAVITSIALDHMQFLGDTIELIAAEKAGILKAGVPAVTVEQSGPALAVIRAAAAAVGAPLTVVPADAVQEVVVGVSGTAFRCHSERWGELRLHTPLIGAHQAENAALAVAAVAQLPPPFLPRPEEVVAGLAAVRWPGRLQLERIGERAWLFDVAHNTAGTVALTAALEALALPRPLYAIVAILGDKDWRNMLEPLAGAVDRLILTTAPGAPAERLWDATAVAAEIGGNALAVPELEHALAACGDAAAVLVTGSFHTVGDALRLLGREP